MRRSAILMTAALLAASSAWAANFTPNVLRLSAPDAVSYDFDGTNLVLPVTVTGPQASVVFTVFTKDKGSSIQKVKNGFLGWHYVNNIDTCLYVSNFSDFGNGQNEVTWSGKDSDGNLVPAGDYTYYLWGYNSQSPRSLVCSQFGPASNSAGMIKVFDENNNILPNPVYFPPAQSITQISADNGGYNNTSTAGLKTRAKFTIGSDPLDPSFVETTTYMGWGDSGKLAFMPGDNQYYFVENYLPKAEYPEGLHHVMKYKWVPNGQSEQVLEFGDNGLLSFNNTSAGYAGPISDGGSELWIVVGDNSYPTYTNPEIMYYVDPTDGTVLRTYDFSWLWWDAAEVTRAQQNGDKYHGGPTMATYRNGLLYCAGLSFCTKQCIDPTQENDDDVTLWINGNGDYVGDRFFDPEAGNKAWYCSAASSAPWVYEFSADANGFSVFSSYDLGAVSMGLLAPDGTGIGYLPLPGDTASMKYGQLFVDAGTPFDGIYCDNPPDTTYPKALWYVGQDSIKGTISTQIAVADDSPTAFTVAQNVPNPFNPTTTISFTLTKAGRTTVEVYNVAGQKVDTLVNASLKTGSHSVTWNAAKFSAGVYFYTVKSGSFSRTLKMTLLK